MTPLCWKERRWLAESSENFEEIRSQRGGFGTAHWASPTCMFWSMVRMDGEVAAVSAADFVGVALAFGAGEVHGAGRREFVEGDAVAIRSDIGALGLRDLRKVHSNAGEAYGLGGGGAGIGGGHFLDGVEIDATHDGCDDE